MTQQFDSDYYAIIDLGSNSFHLWLTTLLANGVQTIDKVKRKVRLASGLDEHNILSEQAIERGLSCLALFADRLQNIPVKNIKVVATATVRLAANADEFLARAEQVLGLPIELLSGIDEAKNIYLGAAYTCTAPPQRLVLDIGGASTELVIGAGFETDKAISLDMGCVTFNQAYFADKALTEQHFDRAIAGAKAMLAPHVSDYQTIGWQAVLGGSGTMQALAEILSAQGKACLIDLAFMYDIKRQLITCRQFDCIDIDGLGIEREPVFASGLAILIALFESLEIDQMQLSLGALREGLLYQLLPDMGQQPIQQRTVKSLAKRFHIDRNHGLRVAKHARYLWQQCQEKWQLDDSELESLLINACLLHEVGVLVEFKNHPRHGQYLLNNADLPGFSSAQRQVLSYLIRWQKGELTSDVVEQALQLVFSGSARALAILRLAIVICHLRDDAITPNYQISAYDSGLTLVFNDDCLAQHPLISAELALEVDYLKPLGIELQIQ
ncbi:guanosine-5'-triphosphate,3'-diphosphate pyrophosphatase [Endozoicomonas sp. G2_1]|uniref:Ppx/GppA phosphatase family protein n=1 Tax=Endozoicomonas sp. G2_1 TaxID=2821091 RepID=UPI001ADAB28C|nr:guanosine-5'-triphosphate,3'-diphosphate pyrophosphatase [Endozoicomonas sp. G2_1]MBO9489971.1 guanosine-5'-triphosphate,3'-diphosphate pyrophosphatase [Endozoicomonas sp. G2_1]